MWEKVPDKCATLPAMEEDAIIALVKFFVAIVGCFFAAAIARKMLAERRKRKEAEREKRNAEQVKRRREHWKAKIASALRESDVDSAVSRVMSEAVRSTAMSRHYAHEALVELSGLTEQEVEARKKAVFDGAKNAEADLKSRVDGPIGLRMRPYKSVEENYQIGYDFVKDFVMKSGGPPQWIRWR